LDLDTLLGKFLGEAERRYGPRDPSYTPIRIEFRGDFPQAWYPGKVRHLSILLSARLSKLQMSVFRDLRRRLERRESSFEPSLPRPAKVPPTGPGWIHEIKHDGFRILARKDGARVRLITRNGYDLAHRFPLAVAAVAALPAGSCLVDSEVIVCDDSGLSVLICFGTDTLTI
jgi:ATP-dependent DNA ligase